MCIHAPRGDNSGMDQGHLVGSGLVFSYFRAGTGCVSEKSSFLGVSCGKYRKRDDPLPIPGMHDYSHIICTRAQ